MTALSTASAAIAAGGRLPPTYPYLTQMRVTLITVGGRGDVQPILALALGLRDAGHDVTFATNPIFEDLVRAYGITMAPVHGNPMAALQEDAGQFWLESAENPLGFVRYLFAMARPIVDGLLRDSAVACKNADAVITTPLAIAGCHAAESLGIPYASAILQPNYPTRAFASPFASTSLQLGPIYNYTTHLLVEQLFWLSFRRPINRLRAAQGLAAAGLLWPARRRRAPYLCGFSRQLIPTPRDWPAWVTPGGYWFLDRPPSWEPDSELTDFLAAGPPPVCLGFGSMKGRNPELLSEMAFAALKSAGLRAVFLTGWGGLAPGAYSDDILVLRDVPHDYLYERVAAVVHHGGAGTTAAALRAGVPSIVLPFAIDQAFWGTRIAALGAGPAPLNQRDLSEAKLAALLRAATGNPTFLEASQAIGERIRAEDGVAAAVSTFEAAIAARPPQRRRKLSNGAQSLQ
jgi:sterol 3beta-glucosyltransferase